MTRADLADVVHNRLGLSRAESAQLVERVLHHMCHSLSEGKNVKISGFGSFILRDKGERVGRNPKTRVEVPIEKRRVMVFKSSNNLFIYNSRMYEPAYLAGIIAGHMSKSGIVGYIGSVPIPEVDGKKERVLLQGDVPSPVNPPSGCAFHPRCAYRAPLCDRMEPPLDFDGASHGVACHVFGPVKRA